MGANQTKKNWVNPEYSKRVQELWAAYSKAREKRDIKGIKETRDNLATSLAVSNRVQKDRIVEAIGEPLEEEIDIGGGSSNINYALVEMIALSLIRKYHLPQEWFKDLCNDGVISQQNKNGSYRNEGLLYAIENYDPNKGILLCVYARNYVKWAILHGVTIRQGKSDYEIKERRRFLNLNRDFIHEFGHPPSSLEKLSDFSGLRIKELEKMKKIDKSFWVSSLDELQEESNDGEFYQHEYEEGNSLNPEEILCEFEEKHLEKKKLNIFKAIINYLDDYENVETLNICNKIVQNPFTENEAKVLVLRFLYDKSHEQTASEIGIANGNSRSLQRKALKKITILLDGLL